MTSTYNRKSLTDMSPPPPPTFSYAQAAKGMSAASAAPSQPNKAPSGSITPAKDVVEPVASELPMSASWADDGDQLGVDGSMDVSVSQSSESTVVPAPAKSAITGASLAQINDPTSPGSPEFGISSVSTLPREDDQSSAPVPSSESTWESKSQSSIQDKATDVTETINEKEVEKEKERGKRRKDKAQPPKPVLQEAPIPTVNIWKQRAAEQQKAKATTASTSPGTKASAATPPTSASNTPARPGVPEGATGSEQGVNETSKSISDGKTPRSHRDRSADDASQRPRRSSRSRDKAEGATMSAPLPSLGDSESWPTPLFAQDEELRRSQGRSEKVQEKDRANGALGGSKSKTNWVTVPITPTVVFNTPLPSTGARRGGRGGGRGGRESASRGGSSASGRVPRDGDRSDSTLASLPNGETSGRRGRPREPGQSTSPSRGKRGLSDDGQARRESKTPSVPRDGPVKESSTAETPSSDAAPLTDGGSSAREPNGTGPLITRNIGRPRQYRRQDGPVSDFEKRREYETGSAVTGAENDSHVKRPSVASMPQVDEPEEKKNGSSDVPTATRNPVSERRNGPYNTYPNRERPERGRGGMRRNGGHGFHTGSAHQFSNGFTSPHVPQHQRYNRINPSRAQSIPSDSFYGRFANGYPAIHGLPPIQTGYMGAGVYPEYNQMYPMSAVPYNVHVDQYTLSSMVLTQLEYYFSTDNLIKDVYMRKHMDSEGFCLLTFIANFNRLKNLSTDLELIKYVSQQSPKIQHRLGADGKDRLRTREGWEKFVLPMGERDPSAQNDGPGEYIYPTPSQPHVDTSRPLRHSSLPPLPTSPMSAPGGFQPMNGIPAFIPTSDGHQSPVVNGLGLQTSPTEVTSLGDALTSPKKSQSASPTNADSPLQYLTNPAEEEIDPFPDKEIASLMVVWRGAETGSSDSGRQLPSPSRTFSDRSSDGRSISEELSTAGNDLNATPNGHSAAQQNESQCRASPEPNDPLAPTSDDRDARSRTATRCTQEAKHNVLWVQGKDSPAHELPEGTTSDLYINVHSKALQERRAAPPGTCPYDMVVLYQFWSHFLIRSFNTTMYNDFRSLAFDDRDHGSDTGLSNLIKFYEGALYSPKTPIRARIARHYVQLATGTNDEGPAFESLRKAWRDGAVPMRNRYIILKFFDHSLKAALDPFPPAPSSSVPSTATVH